MLLLDLIFRILGLFDGGLIFLPLALAVSLCALHVDDDDIAFVITFGNIESD